MNPVIWVEGLLGAGKTELTKKIAQELNLRPIFEPVDNNSYLELFYQDPRRWAYPMQLFLLAERYGLQKLAVAEAMSGGTYSGAIIDRGLPGDRVFAKLHVQAGNISALEWQTYERFYEIMSSDLRPPSLILFLDVDPRVAHARVQKRARSAENGLPLSYLEDLARGYYDLLSEIESKNHAWSRGMRVIRVPWNTDDLPTSDVIDLVARETGIRRPWLHRP